MTGPPPIAMLALGDSYTIGEAVSAGDSWPAQLASMLRDRGHPMAEPVIVARTGWTTDELSAAMDALSPPLPAAAFDLVTLLIGVNNQYRGRDTAEFRAQFRELVARAVVCAGRGARDVLTLSIPDWGVTPFAHDRDRAGISAQIDAFNAVVGDEAARAHCRFVDVVPISRRAATDPRLIASDGLHPSARMYEEWARLALPEALDILRSRARG